MTDSPVHSLVPSDDPPASALFPWPVVREPGAGEKHAAYFTWPDSVLRHTHVPYYAIRGAHPGRSVAIVAGLHGDDASGMLGVQRLGRLLQPGRVHGSLLLLPVVNVPALEAHTGVITPQDGRDLNTIFPGRATGTFSEVLARRLVEDVVAPADAVLSAGGGGRDEVIAGHAGFHIIGDVEIDDLARSTAESAGLAYSVSFSLDDAPGGLINQSAALGKVAVTVNIGDTGGGMPSVYQGLVNALRTLDVLTGLRTPVVPRQLDPGEWVAAPGDGLWQPDIRIEQQVTGGDRLGMLTDLLGHEVAGVTARSAGIVLRYRSIRWVSKGEPLVYVARDEGK